MIWIAVVSPALLTLVTVAALARAAARASKAPQPTNATIPCGDIGVAALSCRPGWEPAYILDATAADGRLIIRTTAPDGGQTGLVLPADVPAALAAVSSLLALDDTPLDASALASAITTSRAGTIIAIRTTKEELS